MDKRCFSEKEGGRVELFAFDNEREEARWVAARINLIKREAVPYNKMAVLYRTKFCSLSFEQAFRAYGIPYQMLGGKGFFERKEIMDINCYITAAAFGKDDAAFERILNIPRRGIGTGSLRKIAQLKTDNISLQAAARNAIADGILPNKISASLQQVIRLLDDIRDMRPDIAIQEVLHRVRYLDYLKAHSHSNSMDYTAREENIEQLIYSASQYETIVDYLEEAALIKEDKEDAGEDSNYGVNLSTIHAAKGLEFQVVFVVGCEENLFPHWKSIASVTGLEEERRLMYVAVTRGERHVFLSYANFRKGQYNNKSRFLDEIEEALDR
jgi:DNA helicase-2/ATP-dependent DNA helicase PcrA